MHAQSTMFRYIVSEFVPCMAKAAYQFFIISELSNISIYFARGV